jgi:membrane associated rhomboid family serine protease
VRWGDIARGAISGLLGYTVVLWFGWTGLLISLPAFAALGWFAAMARNKWRRRDTKRYR